MIFFSALLILLGFMLFSGIIVGLYLSKLIVSKNRNPVSLRPQHFGPGSTQSFNWYFEGQSQTGTLSINEICYWLQSCDYVRDQALFMKRDFWQHPLTFEQIKKGDCEDHALWTWRKLIELGLKAEFIVGDTETERHAWIVFEWSDGKRYLFETTTKQGQMIHTMASTKGIYKPEFSVDENLNTYCYRQNSFLFKPGFSNNQRSPEDNFPGSQSASLLG